jgi:3-hydroxyacyl-CoA dehydrogenase
MGPVTLLDYVGLDTTQSIAEGWEKRYPSEQLFKVPAKLRSLVSEKKLGRKSGQGFFAWEGDKPKAG